jgi:hypothetical protein
MSVPTVIVPHVPSKVHSRGDPIESLVAKAAVINKARDYVRDGMRWEGLDFLIGFQERHRYGSRTTRELAETPDGRKALGAIKHLEPWLEKTKPVYDPLNQAISTGVTPAEAKGIAGFVLKAFSKPGETPDPFRVSIFANVITNNFEDERDDDTGVDRHDREKPAPISLAVAAAGFLELLDRFDSLSPPKPADFRAACMRERKRAIRYRDQIFNYSKQCASARRFLEGDERAA